MKNLKILCEKCKGKGWYQINDNLVCFEEDRRSCPDCGGTGHIEFQKVVK